MHFLFDIFMSWKINKIISIIKVSFVFSRPKQ